MDEKLPKEEGGQAFLDVNQQLDYFQCSQKFQILWQSCSEISEQPKLISIP